MAMEHTIGKMRIGLLMAAVLAGGLSTAQGQTFNGSRPGQAARQIQTVSVPFNMSRVVHLRQSASKVSVGSPEVADILIMNSRELYIVGKQLGSTNVVLWDANGRVVDAYDVVVTHNIGALKGRLHELMPSEDVEVYSSQEAIVLKGEVSSASKMDAAVRLAESFLDRRKRQKGQGKPAARVLNLMEVGGAKQVMLEVQVAEVSRNLTRRLGIKFNSIDNGSNWKIGAVKGGATFPDALYENGSLQSGGTRVPVFGDRTPIGPVVDEFAPNDLSIGDSGLFASRLAGDFLFNAVLEAAKQEGLAKILAEPTLTTMTGEEAKFLSGGEFPIPVPQRVDGGITVEFKEFGIGLRFLPVVLSSGAINLKVGISVSELINQNSVTFNVPDTSAQFSIPALTKRSANATVELGNGQTIGIAGLIDENLRENVNKFPGLADIPVIGALFRSTEYIKGQTELVIFVTPRLAKPITPEQVRLPTDAFVEPSAVEMYLLGRMEGSRPDGVPPQPKGGMEGRFGHDL